MPQQKSKNNKQPKAMTDLHKLANDYYDASVKNAGQANVSISHLQNALLTVILAELAFIGTADLTRERPSVLGIVAATTLIASALMFMLGAYAQWKHVLRTARHYFKLSKDVREYISKTKKAETDDLPEFLSDKVIALRTNRSSDKFFILSILGVLSASLMILHYLIRSL